MEGASTPNREGHTQKPQKSKYLECFFYPTDLNQKFLHEGSSREQEGHTASSISSPGPRTVPRRRCHRHSTGDKGGVSMPEGPVTVSTGRGDRHCALSLQAEPTAHALRPAASHPQSALRSVCVCAEAPMRATQCVGLTPSAPRLCPWKPLRLWEPGRNSQARAVSPRGAHCWCNCGSPSATSSPRPLATCSTCSRRKRVCKACARHSCEKFKK